MAMLVSPRRFGHQPTMILGAAFLALGLISASFVQGVIWQLYLSQGVMVGFGVGLLTIPSMAILPQWFDKKRSLANGIGSAGSGVGGLVWSFATQAMIDGVGLGWSLRITGVVCGCVNVVAAILLRSRNEVVRPPQRGFDTKLLRRYDVWLLLAWAATSMLGYITLLFSLSDFARSIGLHTDQAAAITALVNLGVAVGRPMIGVASDRYGRLETAGLVTFTCGLLCFVIWIPAKTYAVTIVFAILSGGMLGVFWMVRIGTLQACSLLSCSRADSSCEYRQWDL